MGFALETVSDGLRIVIMMLLMITVPGLLLGLFVAVLQAMTQIHEISLTFIPKIIVTFLAVLVFSSAYGPVMVKYTHDIFLAIPALVH
jgi:flagellar biosynthesis protein FliQ